MFNEMKKTKETMKSMQNLSQRNVEIKTKIYFKQKQI